MSVTDPYALGVTRSVMNDRQRARLQLVERIFGTLPDVNVHSIYGRALRHLEEAAELFQACAHAEEVDTKQARGKALGVVGYVFARPAGEISQEVGGSAFTLLSLCEAAHVSFDACETTEAARVATKDPAHFRAKQLQKIEAGVEI